MRPEPEVVWIDIDRLLHEQHSADQRPDCVSNELEAKLVINIVHTLTQVWNNLPEYLRDPELSIDNFRRQLKTFLFAQN